MSFLDTVARAKAYLREHGRVSLRGLKLEFELDDAALDGVIEELVDVQQVAAREGKVLSWVGPASDHALPAASPAATPPAPEPDRSPRVERVAAPEPGRHVAVAERRQLTVMFCDLVGSTDLSARLDAEDLRDAVAAYQEEAVAVIEALGGRVAQYLGDGLLVYFGYPQAHEDDPVRAAGAALRILDALPALSERLAERLPALSEHPLRARIGIHTGPVVVGEMGAGAKREDLAVGDTVNLAARLQEIADPGCAVVSAATRQLLRGPFAFDEFEERHLRGISEPVLVARLRTHAGLASGSEPAVETPLVGREQEIALLVDRWEEAREGRGQAVLLSGEAGMGKSRLVRALRERVADQPHRWLEGRGSPYHHASAFHPVIDLLQRGLRLDEEVPAAERLARLRRGLELANLAVDAAVPLFASLLSLPVPAELPRLDLDPELQRKRTLELLCGWLFALAEQQPLILVAEDLHWSDPSTLELLGMLVDQIPTAPIFLLCTHRPAFTPTWPSRSHLAQLPLHPLTHGQMETLVSNVAGQRSLPREVVQQIVARTDRVPLFVEELTKTVLESELLVERNGHLELAGSLPDLAIPATLQDSLMARLDRLGPAKEVAQLCAALGRDFSHELIEAVSPLDPPLLAQMLAGLAGAELLYQRGVPPNCVYHFKHALLQEMAYQSLLKRTRQEYHARIARALEERFPERIDAEPELAARHFEEGGQPERAVDCYQEAGSRAIERSANAEAIVQLRKAVELVGTLPAGGERDRREIPLQTALGTALYAVTGVGSAEVEGAFGRARALCERLDEAGALGPALVGLLAFYAGSSRLEEAEATSQQLLRLAERHGRRDWLLEACFGLGVTHYFQGKSEQAVARLEEAVTLAGEEVARNWRGEVPAVVARIYAAWALWLSGRPDRSVERIEEAVQLVREENHPFSLAYAYTWGSVVHFMRRERGRALAQADRAIAIAEPQGYPVQLEVARLIRAWAQTRPEDSDEKVEQTVAEAQQTLGRLGATGTQAAAPQILGGIAELLLESGRLDDAIRHAELGLALAASTGQPYWDAELLRLKGEALLRRGGADACEAEALFERGVELARGQGARSLELRLATRLARCWSESGRGADARSLLGPVYERASEGFGTQDLREAKALLDAPP